MRSSYFFSDGNDVSTGKADIEHITKQFKVHFLAMEVDYGLVSSS